MTLQIFKDTFNVCFSAYKKVEPFQPMISTWVITGKVLWIQKQYSKWEKEIHELTVHIERMSHILRQASFPDSKRQDIKKHVRALQAERTEKVRNLRCRRLALAQIPSLFLPTPLFNLWNTGHQIVSRSVTLQHAVLPINGHFQPSTEKIIALASGAISIVGTTASFLRQTGCMSSDNMAGHLLIGLALGVNAIEGFYLAKNWLYPHFERADT